MVAAAFDGLAGRLPAHGVDKAERSHVRREIAEGLRWL